MLQAVPPASYQDFRHAVLILESGAKLMCNFHFCVAHDTHPLQLPGTVQGIFQQEILSLCICA